MIKNEEKTDQKLNLQKLLNVYGTRIPVHITSKLSNHDFKEFKAALVKHQLRTGDVSGSDKIANVKRRINELIRPHVKARKKPKRHNFSKGFISGRYTSCRIMNSLVNDREKKWIEPLKRRGGEKDLVFEDFSFLDNPLGTIEKLYELSSLEGTAQSLKINFDDEYCLDVGPYLIFGIIRQNMLPITKGGMIALSVMKVIEAVGLRHFLSIGPIKIVQSSRDIWAFPMQQKNVPLNKHFAKLAIEPTSKEKIQDLLVAKINEWLFQVGTELSRIGRGKISTMAGEALDNGERHSDPDHRIGNWTIAGFMAKRSYENGDQLICHLTIMSIGASIGETIDSTTEKLQKKIGHYCDRHSGGLLRNKLSRETLKTVCALQDGVSRLEQENGGVSGGTGIMEFVELMNELGASPSVSLKPQLTIISGKSCILFKDKYSNGVSEGEDAPRTQWFNPKNTRDEPPDSNYVFDLPHRLPGTIVTMRFSLDEETLQAKADGNGRIKPN